MDLYEKTPGALFFWFLNADIFSAREPGYYFFATNLEHLGHRVPWCNNNFELFVVIEIWALKVDFSGIHLGLPSVNRSLTK